MAYAYGFGHGMGMGFGLGFLNFIGTILFIIAVVWVFKLVVRGFRGCAYERFADDNDSHGDGGWGRHAWRGPRHFGYGPAHRGGGRHAHRGPGHGPGGGRSHGGRSHGGRYKRDEALEVARERLARGQIDTAEYERLRVRLTNGASANDMNAAAGSGEGNEGYRSHEGRRRGSRRDQALEIARMRFATGELSDEEFDSVKRALDG